MQDLSVISTGKRDMLRLQRLFFARLLASMAILFFFTWLESSAPGQVEHPVLSKILVLWLLLTLLQAVLFRFPSLMMGNLLFQLLSDLLLVGMLIFGSGGIVSPFIFLLGVVIITAGTQARVLVVLITAVLACITYLIAIYSHAVLQHLSIADHTLNILLQNSVLLLAGGIMALIARRHAELQQEKRQVTTKHRRLQELHSQVLAAMQEGILVLNDHMHIQDFNQAASNLLGISHQHTGQDLNQHLHTPDAMRDFIRHPKGLVFRVECQHQGQPLLLTLTRLLEEESAWLLTIVNISEVRQLERQLAEQDKLASIGQMSAMLAHEIRNPMQTIAQAVELMGLGSNKLNLERIIGEEISRLNRLVSDMLDYAHPLHPHPQRTDIPALIAASVQQVDLTSKYQVQTQTEPCEADIDPDHFRLLLDNILRNAIIASPQPASITIGCKQQGEQWLLTIRDHGKGIAPEMRDKLFEPFQTGRKTGTGLGLATVLQVCQTNDWQIVVDDSVEDGACFKVTGSMVGIVESGEHHG